MSLPRIGLNVLGLLYCLGIFCQFVSPYQPLDRFSGYLDAPPHRIRFFHEGKFMRPFILDAEPKLNMETFRTKYTPKEESPPYPIRFWVKGTENKLFGLIKTQRHLFGTGEVPIFLFGTDRLGRDVFTRTMYGSLISLSIGLVGVVMSFILGLFIGSAAGYFGGIVDQIAMRTIDFILSIPTIPLWMALSVAVPREWSVESTYFFITLILSLISWPALARQVRGKFLSLREEDFVTSARLVGSNELRIMAVHLFPSFTSHLNRDFDPHDSGNDYRRNSPEFSGLGYAASGCQLGRSAAGCPRPGYLGLASLEVDPQYLCDRYGPDVQFLGRRHAGRRRSVRDLGKTRHGRNVRRLGTGH